MLSKRALMDLRRSLSPNASARGTACARSTQVALFPRKGQQQQSQACFSALCLPQQQPRYILSYQQHTWLPDNQIQHQCFHRYNSKRTFARPVRKSTKPPKSKLLKNEALVAALLRNARGARADQITVRLLYDETVPDAGDDCDEDGDDDGDDDNDTESEDSDDDQDDKSDTIKKTAAPPATKQMTQVVSLATAIQTSIDMQQDLVEISIKQETPVVKVADIRTLEYRQLKKAKANKPKAQKEKEVRFKVGIAAADLQRKMDQAVQYLEKGDNVRLQVRCPGYLARRDPDNAMKLVRQVLELTAAVGEKLTEPTSNPGKTQVIVKVRPVSKK